MRFRRKADPDVIAFKHGGGWQTLFGFPFLAVGVLSILTCVGILPLGGEEDGEWAIMAAGFFGVVFAGLGAVLIFGRSGVLIDRRQGQVVQWRGLLVPFERNARALDRFDRVRLEIRRDERGASYPVLLKGRDAAEAIIVDQPGDYRRARRTAEKLALFVGIPLEDLCLDIPQRVRGGR